MDPVASARTVQPQPVEFITWPEPGKPGAWGELTVIGLSSGVFSVPATPYAIGRLPTTSASDLAAELDDWLLAGAQAFENIDSYIDALDAPDLDDGEG